MSKISSLEYHVEYCVDGEWTRCHSPCRSIHRARKLAASEEWCGYPVRILRVRQSVEVVT
jgi:hypothetical protein